MKARDITQVFVIVAMWVIIILLVVSLFGCLTLSNDSERNLGGFSVDADCEDDTIHVELHVNKEHKDQDAGIEK